MTSTKTENSPTTDLDFAADAAPKAAPDLDTSAGTAGETAAADVIDRPTLSISLPTLAAGSLAAITSAVLGSHLGTLGTLAGAALGSVLGAVSTAVYTFGIQRTLFTLKTLSSRRAKLIVGVLALAVAAFLVSLLAITGIEKATGTSLAGNPGGTTVERVGRVATGGSVERAAERDADPLPSAAASASATPEPTSSSSATPAATPEASAASEAPTSSDTTTAPDAPVAPAAVEGTGTAGA